MTGHAGLRPWKELWILLRWEFIENFEQRNIMIGFTAGGYSAVVQKRKEGGQLGGFCNTLGERVA